MPITLLEQFINVFSDTICKLTKNKTYSSLVFLCIGTDRITGDSFGPIVGYHLKKLFKDTKNVAIFGDLENIVCSINIDSTINKICKDYSNPFIISIDSALSKNADNVGKLFVDKGGIVIGSSISREKFIIGDMHIKGVIAKDLFNSKKNFYLIQNTRLNMIIKMADIVSNGIYQSIKIET